ncbi:MAG: dockerin type I domain-containing protein [Oscillospiraceae bacterium]|nr:dockerin type I domain-containing protein [Oscillospiraceae bacterium]
MSDIRKKLSVLISAALFIAAFVSPFNADMLRTNAESFFVPEIVSDTTYTSSVDGEASQTDGEVVFEGFAENDYVTLANDSGSIAVMANEDDYQFSLSAINSAPAGESVTIRVNGNGRPDNWSCSYGTFLSVYADSASVICSYPGDVTITASNDYCTAEITIRFYYLSTTATTTMEEISKSTHSVDISIDIDNYSHYYVGQTVSFTYYANDMYGYGTPSDYEISVSGDGKLLSGNCIELTGRGSVCLMITAYQETSSAMIWYKGVEMIDIESMAINLKSPDDSLMYVGSRFKLSYDSPENFRNVTWSSSDESVAEVDSSGYVTIKDYGAAKIYVNAESKYGEKVSDYITILLTSPIVIDLAEPEQSQLHIGESFSAGTVSGDVMYTDWTSDNTSVASVDDSGMITINGPGRVTITVSVEGHYSNYATDSITFFVKNDPEISIVKPSSDLLFVTNEFQIEYKSYFADRILWSSSDTGVAEIDSFGNVSICGTGTVTIKASAYGNGITVNDSVTFAVSKTVPSGAALVPASVKLCPGEKCSLECVNLSDGTTVKYFSDKPEVAEINSGVITAKSLGETVIYAIADGEVFECRVSVCSKKQCSGDVDADGTFSTDDIVALRNYIFGIIEYIDFAAADLDGDGTVSSLDLALLRKMYAQSYNNV